MKKNNKGFTLVELIVVAAIMSIMMGAILNFIKPINEFYNSTWATTDATDIGNGVVNYLDKELRYTTNMLILEDYEGMPEVSGGYLINDSGAKSSVKFTDVIIIDNNNPRGSSLDDFDPTTTAARRKGAKGAMLKASLASGTIDIPSTSIILSEPTYSDFKAEFTARLAGGTKNKCLEVGIKQWKPKYEGGSWQYDKVTYDQKRNVELVNINVIGAAMKVNYYTNTTDEDGNLLGTAIDYSQFAQASNPGSLTAGQDNYYDTGKKYTYIFYTKGVPSTTAKCTIKILNDAGTAVNTFKVSNGTNITDAQYEQSIAFFPDTTVKVGDDYKKKSLDYLYCSITGKKLEEYKTEAVTEDMEFTAKWQPEQLIASPQGYVSFYDEFDDTGAHLPDSTFEKYKMAYYTPNATLGVTNTITGVGDGAGDADNMFEGWYDAHGNKFVDGQSFVTGNHSFYAKYTPRPKKHVIFEVNGSVVSDEEYAIGTSNAGNITKPSDPTPPADHLFLGWYEDGDSTKMKFESLAALDRDMTFAAVFTPVPVDPPDYTEFMLTVKYENKFNQLVVTPGTEGGNLWFGLDKTSYAQYWSSLMFSESKSATFAVKFKTASVPIMNIAISKDWSTMSNVNIDMSHFVGKTSGTVTVDASGNVTYS